MHHFFWTLARIFTIIALLLGYSPLVWSQESSDPQLPEKLMLRGGWAHVFGTAITVAVPGRVSGVGTSIDFVETLGGDTNTDGPMPSIGSTTDMPSDLPGTALD